MILAAKFPTTVWNELTVRHTKSTDNIDPTYEDWDQIAAEVVAIETYLVSTRAPTLVPGDLAITAPIVVTQYMLNKGSAAAITLAAPTATTDDGKIIKFMSTTAFAHVITFTGSTLNNGSTTQASATLAAHPGASIELLAYQAKWYVVASNGTVTYA